MYQTFTCRQLQQLQTNLNSTMLHLFTKSSSTIVSTCIKPTCSKSTLSASNGIGFRLLRKQQTQPRLFRQNTWREYTRLHKPQKKANLEPVPASENLPVTEHPKLLYRLKAQGSLSQDTAPRELSHVRFSIKTPSQQF